MKRVYEESDQETGDSILPDFLQGSTSEVYKKLLRDLLISGDTFDASIEYQCRRLYWACDR